MNWHSALGFVGRVRGAIVRRMHHLVLDRGYDRSFGIETAGVHQANELSIPSENARFASEYAATPRHVFRRALTSLEIDFSRFVFVDLGSGKGRILLLASQFPFRRIEGVEFARELHEVASRNLSRWAQLGERVDHIHAHHRDATEYRIPDEPCVFFLYNPFGEPVLSRVLDNIEASYVMRPRPMCFVYSNPKLRHLFEQRAFIREIRRGWRTRLIDRLTCPEALAIYRTELQ
jgi:hypothetical protein